MATCQTCNFITCTDYGTDLEACVNHQDNEPEPEFEAYTFDERTGSENIHFFRTAAARDAFIAKQPDWKMAH